MSKSATVSTLKSNPNCVQAPQVAENQLHTDHWAPCWQEMFIRCEHWQSDLAFIRDEILFLQKLIQWRVAGLLDEKYVEGANTAILVLSRLECHRAAIYKKVTNHLSDLGNLVENPHTPDGQVSQHLHAVIGGMYSAFTKRLKRMKKNVFQLVEGIELSSETKSGSELVVR